jgi:hypothetical protein
MATDTIERPATPHEIVERAITARCCITEALAQLDGIAPSRERTVLGNELLRSYHRLGAWIDAGGYLGASDGQD